MRDKYQYDAFLSHRSVNKPWVETLAHNLVKNGFNVFFDGWELTPGCSLVRSLAEGIDRSRKGILIATPEACESGWVNEEFEAMTERRQREPGFLIPLTFGTEADFPFLKNVLTVDFSDPSRETYRKSFYRLICGLRDQKPGSEIRLDHEPTIPEPIHNNPRLLTSQSLPSSENQFLEELFDTLNVNNIALLLAQTGIDRNRMHRAILERSERKYGQTNTLHITPLVNPDADLATYFSWIGNKCALNRESKSGVELQMALDERLQDNTPLFLLITRIEDGSSAGRKSLANTMRALSETHGDRLHIVLCGGEKLAALKYANGQLSAFSSAEVLMWPEPTVRDVLNQEPFANLAELDSMRVDNVLKLTGRHPRLLQYHLKLILKAPDLNEQYYINALEEYALQNGFFSRYRQHPETKERLQQWLDKNDVVAPYNPWPSDELLRKLYWDNLLSKQKKSFVWRCDLLRRAGQQELRC